MATTKKPNPSKPEIPSFNFQEYEEIKSLYKNTRLILQCLKETKQKVPEINDKIDNNDLAEIASYLMSTFNSIVNHGNPNSPEVKGLVTLYREILDKLTARLDSLSKDYINRYNILKAKLEDLEEKKKEYIDFQMKSIHQSNVETSDDEWKHVSDINVNDILNAVLSSFGLKIPQGKAIVIDGNGCYFK